MFLVQASLKKPLFFEAKHLQVEISGNQFGRAVLNLECVQEIHEAEKIVMKLIGVKQGVHYLFPKSCKTLLDVGC